MDKEQILKDIFSNDPDNILDIDKDISLDELSYILDIGITRIIRQDKETITYDDGVCYNAITLPKKLLGDIMEGRDNEH